MTTDDARKRVLIIEDDEGLSKFLQMLLQRRGYNVDAAFDGATGLEMCKLSHYDAVLVDYIMPAMDGLEVLRYAVNEPNLPPMILMTGSGNEAVAVEAMKLGAADYIVKDSGKAFVDALERVIEDSMAQDAVRKRVLASLEHDASAPPKENASSVETPTEIVTICAWTGDVKFNDEWIKIEDFLKRRFGVSISHGISPKALARYGKQLKST
jgi:DNA-binding response OmpR family regulator